MDPLSPDYPELTPYQFASNTPIWAIDLDGLEAYYAPTKGQGYKFLGKEGNSDEVIIFHHNADEIAKLCKTNNSYADVVNREDVVSSSLLITHNQLLDRANWIIAEQGGSKDPKMYLLIAYVMENIKNTPTVQKGLANRYPMLRDNSTEEILYWQAMVSTGAYYTREGGVKDGDYSENGKNQYLSGGTKNKAGKLFWDERNNIGSVSSNNSNAVSAVIYSLMNPKKDPTGGALSWVLSDELLGKRYKGTTFVTKFEKGTPSDLSEKDIPDSTNP